MEPIDIERWLLDAEWPSRVRGFQTRRDLDSEGERGVWIWVLVDDPQTRFDDLLRLRDRVYQRMNEYDPSSERVYVRFRDAEEVAS